MNASYVSGGSPDLAVRMNMSDVEETLVYWVVPSFCIAVATADFVLNILLLVVHVKLKFWRCPATLAYANMILLGTISSLAATLLFTLKVVEGSDPNEIRSQTFHYLLEVLFAVEIYSISSGLVSTFLLAILRLLALMFPFAFVNVTQHRYMLPLITASWILGCGVAYAESHFWALDTHQVLVNVWFIYLAISLTIFTVAVSVLGPLRKSADKFIRTVAGRLFALAFCYILCNGCFGAFNIARFYLCVQRRAPAVLQVGGGAVERVLCRTENFITVVFIFPTLNSIANALVIARSQRVKSEIRSWCCA